MTLHKCIDAAIGFGRIQTEDISTFPATCFAVFRFVGLQRYVKRERKNKKISSCNRAFKTGINETAYSYYALLCIAVICPEYEVSNAQNMVQFYWVACDKNGQCQ